MRVALFANRVVDPLGSMTGIGRYILELVRALPEEAGATDYMLCAPPERGVPPWLPGGVGFQPLRRPRQYVNGSWTVLHRPRLETLVGPFDVLHVLHPSFPVPTLRPAVLTVHDLLPLQHPDWSRRHDRIGFARTLTAAIDNGWVMTAVSDSVAGQLRQLPGADPHRIRTVHLGIGPEFTHPVAPEARAGVCRQWGLEPDDYFLAIGRITPRKNILTAVRALHRLPPEAPALALAGQAGAEAAPVLREIERLGLQARVRVLGHVPDGQLVALLQSARGLVHPSLAEGFGLPVLEAFAAGTPVLASDGGSLPEIVGEAGIRLDPSDPDGWAGAMLRLGRDDDLRDRLRRAGRQRAAAFTWQRTAEGARRAHEMAARA